MKNDTASGAAEARPFLDKLGFFGRPYVFLPLFLLAAVVAYSNTFDAPFHFDSVMNITLNPMVTKLSNIPVILSGKMGPFASRPIMHSTFAMNYYFGKLDPWGYHITNLAIHLVNGILVYLLVSFTGGLLRCERGEVRLAGALAAMLFLLHPVQTEGVTYIVSRSMLFATMFFLAGIVLYAKAVTSDRRRALYVAGLVVASLLGMGSRENFATFTVMVIVYDAIFITRLNFKETLKHYWAYVPVFLTLGYLAFVISNNTYDTAGEFKGMGVPHRDYFFTQFRVHWTYLRLLVLPVNQNIDYDYRISSSLFEWRTLVAAAGYLGLWAFGIANARKRPVAAFSVIWFLVTLLPIAFGVTFLDLRLDDVIFEHRLYLPGAGLIMGASAWAAHELWKLDSRRRAIAVAAVVLVLAPALSAATYARNSVWHNEFTLWGDAVRKSPHKARPNNNLGFAYFTSGFPDQAVEHYKDALAADPDYGLARYNIALAYSDLGMRNEAREQYEKAVELRPDLSDAQINLGNIYMDMGRPDLAAERYRAALKAMPMDYSAYVNLGNAYLKMGQYKEAINEFWRAIEIDPYRAATYNNLANAYYALGRTEEANKYFKKAMELQRMGR